MTGTGHVAALILAAGASRRLGTAKQLLSTPAGDLLLRDVVRTAHEAGIAPIVVVYGAHASEVRAVLDALPEAWAVRAVHNAEWATGMAASIRHGLDALTPTDCTAALLLACDQPAVHAAHLRALLATHAEGGGRVVSTYDGVSGIPAIWPREDWPALGALEGDRGAKGLLRGDEPSIPLPHGALDLDTPADVAAWRALRSRGTGSDPAE